MSSGNSIYLVGSFKLIEVFSIRGKDLLNARTISFRNIASNVQLILVNVYGKSSGFSGMSFFGAVGSKTIFNFYEAKSLTFSGVAIEGTVLAPKAAISANNGELKGQIFALSWIGDLQVENFLFSGCICA